MIAEKRGFFVINVGHVGDSVWWQRLACQSHLRLSCPTGRVKFLSDLCSVSLESFFFFFSCEVSPSWSRVQVMGLSARVLSLGPSGNSHGISTFSCVCWWQLVSAGEWTKREYKGAEFRTLGNTFLWGIGRKIELIKRSSKGVGGSQEDPSNRRGGF